MLYFLTSVDDDMIETLGYCPTAQAASVVAIELTFRECLWGVVWHLSRRVAASFLPPLLCII